MGRPRAGHAWTWIMIGTKSIALIMDDEGHWIPSGCACRWPRCKRCRRPFQEAPFNSGMCTTCYFYKSISVQDFWKLHDEGYRLAPYNIGRKINMDILHETKNSRNWRACLRRQFIS